MADAKQKENFEIIQPTLSAKAGKVGWWNKLTRLVITTQFVLAGCFVAALIGLLGVPGVSGLE